MSLDLTASELTLCECYQITTLNGLIARWTNYQENLTFLGETFQAIPIGRGKIGYHSNLQVDKVQVFLGLVGITVGSVSYTIPQAIKYGYLRDATIKIYLVDYNTPANYQILFDGVISGEVTYNKGIVTLEAASILDKLNDGFPKMIYSEYCNHKLFSARCGLDAADYVEAGTTLASSTNKKVYASIFAFSNHGEGYWDRGKFLPTSGNNDDISRTILKHYDGYVLLLLPFPNVMAVDDTFNAWPGCDKNGQTCDEKFSNYVNFFGFEYIPRPETLYE